MAYQNNATQIVYDLICEKIRNKEWTPGERIWTEQEFTNKLGVSRVAVRQAIEKLVITSVLKKVQGSGTYVQEYDPMVMLNVPTYTPTGNDLLEIIRFRATFESSNVEYFIQNATAEDRQTLIECYEKMASCDISSEAFYLCDFQFHSIIAEGTKNGFISKINAFISDSMIKHQKLLHHMIGPQVALEYHPLILKYILDKDAELASLLMRRHMEATASEIQTYIAMHPEGAGDT